MSSSGPRRRLLAPATPALLVAIVAIFALGCSGTSSTPAATVEPTVEPTPVPSPSPVIIAPTLEPVAAITFGDRVTFYGKEAGDSATGLAAGDFNGDGILDAALTASFADGPANGRRDSGEAYIFFGPFAAGESRDVAQNHQDVTIFGASEEDQLGRAVAAADVNGDGIDDIVLGAPFADGPEDQRPDAGDTIVIFGSESWPDSVDLAADSADAVVFGADEKDLAGFSLATADANGDGVHDILIGAFWADGPDDDRPDAGEAYLILGSPAWPSTIDLADGTQDVTVFGAEAGDHLSEAVAAGDIDGNGVDDLILPAPFASGPENQRPSAGEVYVILGGELDGAYDMAEHRPEVTVIGPDDGDQIGHSVAVGDFDGDGGGSLLLGAVSADGPGNGRDLAGEVYLIPTSGRRPATFDTLESGDALVVFGSDSVDRLGRSVAAGDLNGDGLSDMVLAATGGDGQGTSAENAGELHIVFGRPALRGALDLAHQAADMIIAGLDANDAMGQNTFGRSSLLSVDMDDDGLDDVLVSALGDGPANDRADAGEVYILFALR